MSVAESDLSSEYGRMAADTAREVEANVWADALLGDVSDEERDELP